jgi:hypothetical protein
LFITFTKLFMKTLTQYIAILVLFIIVFAACNKEKTLAKSESNINFFSLKGSEIVEKTITLANGNIALTGSINKNGFVAVFDENGNKLWYEEVGGSEFDELIDIIETSDGSILAVGRTSSLSEGVSNTNYSDGWLVNYSVNGTLNWKKAIGSDKYEEILLSALETPAGDFILTGEQRVSGSYTYIAKVSKDGSNLSWGRSFRIGPWHSYGKSMVLDPDGNVILAGLCSNGAGGINLGRLNTYLANINIKFGVITYDTIYDDFVREMTFSSTRIHGGALILQNEVDGYSWTTFMEGTNLSGKVQFAKVDFNKNLLLERKYSGLGNVDLKSTIKLKNGSYLICGESSADPLRAYGFTNSQAYLLNIDGSGETIWSSTLGSTTSTQCAFTAMLKDDLYSVYCSSVNSETSWHSFAKYKLDKLGDVIK